MRRMVAMAVALMLGAAGLVLAFTRGGVGDLPADELRATYPTYDEVASWDFMAGEYGALLRAGADPKLVFGSSELKSRPAGPAHPARLFGDGRYGVTSVIAGRAGVNDLWQALEIGAFSPAMPDDDKRAVVFVSMQWFMCYRDPDSSFPGVFSQGAYDAFMSNGDISDDVKRRVADRARAYGVGDAEPRPGDPLERAVEWVDRGARALVDDVRLAADLRRRGADAPVGAGAHGASPASGADAAGAPDWDALMADGHDRAARLSAGNEFGFYDSWYESSYRDWLSGAQRKWRVDDGAYWSAEELEDFELMLEVCRQTGVEPLVVIQPVKGAAYDQTIYSREVRAEYYDMIRSACARAGVRVADFSDREYDPLFLRDYSHPSAYGSALYSRAIYDFWMG